MNNAKYVIDASVILDSVKYDKYDYNAFPIHWRNIDKLIEKGIIISPEKAKREIKKNGSNFFKKWADKYDYMFKLMDAKVVESLNFLSENYPEWYNNIHNKKTSADPYLIAFAMAHNLHLVTHERMQVVGTEKNSASPKNYKIPTVCYLVGANIYVENWQGKQEDAPFDCISFVELSRREKLYK